jgi:two-component system sensor histidine kinase KdpD
MTAHTLSSPRGLRQWSLWAGALGLLAAVTAVGFWTDARLSLASLALLYVLAIALAAYHLSPVPALLNALVAVLAFNFFFVPPRWTLAVDGRENLIVLGVMLGVALVISHLVARLRQQTLAAHQNAGRAQQLQALAIALGEAGSAGGVRVLAESALARAFTGPHTLALFAADGSLECSADLEQQVVDGLQCCMREAAVLGPGTGRWPGLNAWYLPLGRQGHMQGAVYLGQVDAADTAGREHAQALCALVAQALWRLQLSAHMLASQAQAQRQQLQSTYLAAISHDLRTPLAAVLAAATALQIQGDKLSAADQTRLLNSIVNETAYLSTVTENTLQLVHLGNTTQSLHTTWESMEEIVGAVLARWRQRDPERRIRSCVPEGLPLLRADPVLLAQLLGNLLDNALKYSAGAIELDVRTTPLRWQVSVKDRGAQIPAERYDTIFAPYMRGDHSGRRGAGLGLALCRAIAQAHGGTLQVWPRRTGGNRFTLELPLAPHQPEPQQADGVVP